MSPASIWTIVSSICSNGFITLILMSQMLLRDGLAQTSALNPCSFPTPAQSGHRDFCTISYSEKPYLCDPGSLMSRTEAEVLDKTVSNHFTSCDAQDEPEKRQIAIFLIPNATFRNSSRRNNRPFSNYFKDRNIATCSYAEEFSEKLMRHNKHRSRLFSSELSRRLSRDHCLPDVIISVFYRWETVPSSGHGTIYAFFVNNLRNIYWVHRQVEDPVLFNLDAHEEPFRSLQKFIAKIIGILQDLKEKEGRKPETEIPTWAILLCVVLILLALLSVVVGTYISSFVPSRKSAMGGRGGSHRGGWVGLGLGGRVPGDGGQGGGAFSRGTMMFRQFSRRTHASTGASGGAPHSAI